MGRIQSGVVVCVLWWLAACGGDSAAAGAGDGELALELGGDNPPLRSALEGRDTEGRDTEGKDSDGKDAQGGDRDPTPPTPSRDGPRTGGAEKDVAAPGSGERPSDGGTQGPAEPPDAVASAGGYRSVILGKGETLYHLAVHHLDDGNRWREILQLNGWSEDQVEDLQEGQRVRLPAK